MNTQGPYRPNYRQQRIDSAAKSQSGFFMQYLMDHKGDVYHSSFD